jgi:hypothetical protein
MSMRFGDGHHALAAAARSERRQQVGVQPHLLDALRRENLHEGGQALFNFDFDGLFIARARLELLHDLASAGAAVGFFAWRLLRQSRRLFLVLIVLAEDLEEHFEGRDFASASALGTLALIE